jgi:hypothetical protein
MFLEKDQAQFRYTICKSCDNFNLLLKICNKCGCFMPVKVKVLNSECPLKKWNVV